jgi:hypothetical protein
MIPGQIVSYPAPYRSLFGSTATGRVLSVHRRSLYVELQRSAASGRQLAAGDEACPSRLAAGAQILAIVDISLGNGPLNLVAKRLDTYDFSLNPGDPARMGDRVLVLGNSDSVDTKPLAVSLREGHPWDPYLRLRAADLDPKAVAACAALVEQEGPIESLAVLLPILDNRVCTRGLLSSWQQTALAAIRRLLRGLRTDNVGEIQSGARRLSGLGPGLTPSGDDFLVGVLIGLRLAGGKVHTILEVATETTRISRAYLEAAAHGQANEPWHGLLRDLRRGRGWEASARGLGRFGETSGADMMTGFFAWWNVYGRYNGKDLIWNRCC